jgi:3-keto-disaccharide hydrolase
MRRVVLGLILAGAAIGTLVAASDPNTLTAQQRKDGWKLLFDGKTLDGWRGWKQPGPPDGWKVVDGALTRVAKAGDLITVDQYGSFDFTFEWRIAKNGNSGVFFHVAEAPDLPNTFTTGPEYQLIDNDGHPDAKNGPDRLAGGNYALHPPVNATPKPIGEWNASRILVNGPRVEHWLNGLKVVEYELWSADWKDRVQKSKFKAMPRYGLEKTGHIALQDHGDEVAFRALKIKVLGGGS